jgi:uncharacterized repeat protein (TIGR03803 family)
MNKFVLNFLLLSVFAACALGAQTTSYGVIKDFDSTAGGIGANPAAPFVEGPDGNLYFALATGGNGGDGTLVRMTTSGPVTVLHYFDGSDGLRPLLRLTAGTDGLFHGTTPAGGGGTGSSTKVGVAFTISSGGTFDQLYAFNITKQDTNSSGPHGTLIEDAAGNFWGTTQYLGADDFGSIFKLSPSGEYSLVYSFTGTNADGGYPLGGLVQASDGNFYGVASDEYYGSNGLPAYLGAGTAYRITPQGQFNLIHTFTATTDGGVPATSLVVGPDGDLYGTTIGGGNNHKGTFYKMTTDGALTVLHYFDGADGANPEATPYLASDGNFYSTSVEGGTGDGGKQDAGTIYRISPSGSFTNLYNFCSQTNCADGELPQGPPRQASDGQFYGSAFNGGDSKSDGVAYKLTITPALLPPVQLSFSPATVAVNAPTTLTFKVPNAFSETAQLCFATPPAAGGGPWSGIHTGSLISNVFTGTASITPTAAGTYMYALTCGGNESGFATLTVTSTKANTSTALTGAPNPVMSGSNVTLTATVTKGSGGATPTGSVEFIFAGSALATVPLGSNGHAVLTASTTGYPLGNYALTAKYLGDENYNGSTSPTFTQTISAASTSTAVTANPNPVPAGANVTISAKVASSSGTATGKVTFSTGTTTLDVVALSHGTAALTASTAGYSAGTYVVKASYPGDATHGASSGTVSVVLK